MQTGYRFLEDKHLHTLDGKPLMGTTSVLGVLHKELTYWASGMACGVFGWQNPKKVAMAEYEKSALDMLTQIKSMDLESYIKLLNKAYRAHSEKKKSRATEGVNIHALCEEWIKAKIAGLTIAAHDDIKLFVEWAERNVGRWLWSEAHCYSREYWVGGITDFGYLDLNGKAVLGDIKSGAAYYSAFFQCGAYDIQIRENGLLTPDGRELAPEPENGWEFDYYNVLSFKDGFKQNVYHNTMGMREAFKACLVIHRQKQRVEEGR